MTVRRPIFGPEWESAAVLFPAIGEEATVPTSPETKQAFCVSEVMVRYEQLENENEASGHAGNGLWWWWWWCAPTNMFKIGNDVRMRAYDAERLAKWILMMVGKPVKEPEPSE